MMREPARCDLAHGALCSSAYFIYVNFKALNCSVSGFRRWRHSRVPPAFLLGWPPSLCRLSSRAAGRPRRPRHSATYEAHEALCVSAGDFPLPVRVIDRRHRQEGHDMWNTAEQRMCCSWSELQSVTGRVAVFTPWSRTDGGGRPETSIAASPREAIYEGRCIIIIIIIIIVLGGEGH
ncbi:unnamed protein product [Pleuronectes platessa]|uniref:Uncharacterized protein n=1 Tax=Pleuronectes platessa TaxID=8262 RepID=A0A9N7UYA0_PLEPL|nr:unnamed protein product [Pleuronectes platessa]